MKISKQWVLLGGVTFAAALGTLFLRPVPQWPDYHHFIDQRTIWGIPCFMDVVSNLPFLLVGLLGFKEVLRQRARGLFQDPWEALPYMLFFLSFFCTALGSTYYHLAPDDARLVWDRIPITMIAMSLVSIVLMEKTGVQTAIRLLGPLLVLGVGSVVYWRWTGDLRFYGFVQFYPVLFVPLVLYLFSKPFPAIGELVRLVICYGLAKFFEWKDVEVFSITGGMVSGHTLKHLLAALGVWWIVRMLRKRRKP